MQKDNLILSLTFEFSLSIINLYKQLIHHKEFVLSKQLLKSGTSIGANVEEAVAAQSRRDFINKMSIASKESRETRYWLRLLSKSQMVPEVCYEQYIESVENIIKILTRIVKTSQQST